MQWSQVRKCFIKSKKKVYIQRRIGWSDQTKNIKGQSIRLKNQIKNIKGQSTSSEEAPEYFGAKRRLLLKNENIMCDKDYNLGPVL
jgi:hypothetical protein